MVRLNTSTPSPAADHADRAGRRAWGPPDAAAWRAARRVLVATRWGIGDLIAELPALKALRRACPRARITAVGSGVSLSLLEGRGLVDEAVAVQNLGYAHLGADGDDEAARRLARRGRFDVVADLLHAPPGLRRAVLDELPGAWRVEHSQPAERAAMERGEGVVAGVSWGTRVGWGVDTRPPAGPTLPPREADRAWADAAWRGLGYGPGDRPAAVAPLASVAIKRWPTRRMLSVARWLAGETGTPTLAFCGPDADAAEEVQRLGGDVVRVAPAAGLNETAALMARCRAFVGNDTGPTYLARAAGCESVAIYGPTDGAALHQGGAVVQSNVPCEHRLVGRCGIPACWDGDACRIGERSCVEAVAEADVRAAVTRLGVLGH